MLLMLGCSQIATGQSIAARDDDSGVHRLAGKLANESFREREIAQRKLRRLASQDLTVRQQVMTALQQAAIEPDLECRIAAQRLLEDIEQDAFDHQVASLANLGLSPRQIDLPGWDAFMRLAGDDHHARTVFATLVRRFQKLLTHPDHQRRVVTSLDLYQIAPDDKTTWILVLGSATQDDSPLSKAFTTKLASLLAHSTIAPTVASDSSSVVLKRLIGRWIERNETTVAARQRLRIAMRYKCFETARMVCNAVFENADAPASSHVAALLCGSAVDLDSIDTRLQHALTDERVSHVWQMVVSRETKIRTQVRDVALALLLHREGIDPRSVGFSDLQADPIVVYREHSLGFALDADRAEAFRNATALLKARGISL